MQRSRGAGGDSGRTSPQSLPIQGLWQFPGMSWQVLQASQDGFVFFSDCSHHPLLFSARSPASSPSPSPSLCLQAPVILGSSRPNPGLTFCVPNLYSLLSPPLEYASSHCPRQVL